MDQEGATQSTAITVPSSNSRLTRGSSSSSSSRNVSNKNNVGEEEGGENGGQQLNRVDEENQDNGCPVSPPSTKKSKPAYRTRSSLAGLSSASPRRKKSGNNSNNKLQSSPHHYNNLPSSPHHFASPLLNNASRSTTLSNTSSSKRLSRGIGAAESSAAASQVLSNYVSSNVLSSQVLSNVNNSNAILSSNTNNNNEVNEICIADKSFLGEGWGPKVTKPTKLEMVEVMRREEMSYNDTGVNVLQPIRPSSERNEVIKIRLSSKREDRLEELCSMMELCGAISATGNTQLSKAKIKALDQPTSEQYMMNALIVNEKGLAGYNEAIYVLIINPATGNVVKTLSSIGYKSGNGKEYNDPDKCVEVVIGQNDVPSHLDEVPKEWLIQRDGGSYRVRITVKYLKLIQDNPHMRLCEVLQCRVVSREVYVNTPEVDAAREAEFVELMNTAQRTRDKRNPSKSSGMVEVYNAVECNDDYDGQTFQAGGTIYCRGDVELAVYDSVSVYAGNNNNPMSVHCSKWYQGDADRPDEYDDLLSVKRTDRKGVYRKCFPEKSNIFKEGSIYYESGFLWKAKNGTYVWVRHLP